MKYTLNLNFEQLLFLNEIIGLTTDDMIRDFIIKNIVSNKPESGRGLKLLEILEKSSKKNYGFNYELFDTINEVYLNAKTEKLHADWVDAVVNGKTELSKYEYNKIPK
jgi:hypothetical protein